MTSELAGFVQPIPEPQPSIAQTTSKFARIAFVESAELVHRRAVVTIAKPCDQFPMPSTRRGALRGPCVTTAKPTEASTSFNFG